MAEKRDFLAECSGDLGLTPQDVQAAFCFRCLQAECSRSLSGKSGFEARTSTWENRLFTSVPRMNEGDPRIVTLRSKKFVEVPTGLTPEIGGPPSAWLDPRDLDVPVESPHSTTSSGPSVALATPEPKEALVEEAQPAAPPEPRPEPQPRPAFLNTPVQTGRMIRGPKPEPSRDPWEVRPKETQGLQVVKPGTRIKLGGSGV